MKKLRSGLQRNLEINAGSTADIAFLLLIFFLVTTTIFSEKGIVVKLPAWESAAAPATQSPVFNIRLNGVNELFVQDRRIFSAELKKLVEDFIAPSATGLIKPKKAIILIQTDRKSKYSAYLSIYNEIKAAYHQLWNKIAIEKYGLAYDKLPESKQRQIRSDLPQIIQEKEPTDFAFSE